MQGIGGNNLQGIKVENQAAIRQFIYQNGPVSRREIAEALRLSLPTITTTVNFLIAKGLLINVENTQDSGNKLGRRFSLVDTATAGRYFMGIEMRGSSRRLAITDSRGKVLAERRDDTFYPDYEENLRETCRIADEMLRAFAPGKENIAAICICLPGLIDHRKNELDVHPGYGWKRKKVAADAARLLNYTGPIVLENNACARAYAAYLFHRDLFGAYASFSYLYVSTGIACPTLYAYDRVHETIAGLGEAGHMVMNPQGPLCSCGNRGCLEAYSSEKAILSACRDGEREPTIQEVLHAQQAGDQKVKKIMADAVSQLGIAIANMDNLIRPDCFIIEGKMFDLAENQKQLLEVVNKNLYTGIDAKFNFVFMEADEFSGAIGAAAVAVKHDLVTFVE